MSNTAETKAPLPESVEKALERCKEGWDWQCGYYMEEAVEAEKTLRAHMAAMAEQQETSHQQWFAEVTRLCKLLSESKAEIERLRGALEKAVDALKMASGFVELYVGVTHNAVPTKNALDRAADACVSVLAPKQPAGGEHE